jgi:hypothetical protein
MNQTGFETIAGAGLPPVALTVDPETVPALARVLSQAEAAELQGHELTIKAGLETFVQVGEALAAIRDRRLYRAEFPTFEEYCAEKWGMTARRARQLWAAADVARTLGNNCSAFVLPATESQARPLTLLPVDRQIEAWQEVVRTAPGGRVTARHVQTVVNRIKGFSPTPVTQQNGGAEQTRPVVIEGGSRELQMKAATNAAIAKTRELLDVIGTADSAAGAEVYNALHRLEKFKDHLARVEDMQASRGGAN